MKKRSNWRRLLALGLATVMTVCMAGCGGKGKGGNDPNGGNSSDPAVNARLAKEYVFRSRELSIPMSGEDVNVAAFRKDGDQIELLTISYSYGEDGSNQTITLHSMKSDGTVQSSKDMELPVTVDETSDQTNDAAQIIGTTLEDVDIPAPVDGDDDFYDDDYGYMNDYSYESTNFDSATISATNVFALKRHYKETYSDDNWESESEESVCCWDKNGKLLWETPVDISQYQSDDTWSYLAMTIPYADGSLGLVLAGDQNGFIKVASDGSVSKLKKSSKDIFSQGPNYAIKDDGTLMLLYYNDDYSKQYLTSYNPEDDTYGQEYEVPQAVMNKGFYNLATSPKYDIVFSNSDGVYGFNLGETDAEKIMDFVNSDLATYGLDNLVFLDDNNFVATYDDPVTYNNQFGFFSYVKPEDIQDKKALVYAGVGIYYDLKTSIIRFNKESDEYRIIVKDYAEYNTEDDYTQGYTKLNNDIIAGNIPDIILLDDSMPIESFVSKGVLANIDEMIKNDPELSTQEYMENAFDAYRVDGVLYRVIPKFSVNTWLAKKSLVGDKTSMTMEEVRQAATKLTGSKTIFGTMYSETTRDSFMASVMSFCGRDFVDVDTGKCNFENKLFADLLEYAKTLPSEEQVNDRDEDYWNEYWENYYTQYRENRVLLMPQEIYDVSNMKYQIKGMFGEPVAFVGFPTESGAGSYIKADRSFAISNKSANKEGAWKFLRLFLTEEYQENKDYKYGYESGIPVLKKLVREQVDQLMERPYWEDEDGNKNYYDDTFWMNGDSIIMDPFTKAEADQLFDFICSVNKSGFFDENVTKIVTEEAGSFFSGSKSTQDVAAMIQNRVQLYVNENR